VASTGRCRSEPWCARTAGQAVAGVKSTDAELQAVQLRFFGNAKTKWRTVRNLAQNNDMPAFRNCRIWKYALRKQEMCGPMSFKKIFILSYCDSSFQAILSANLRIVYAFRNLFSCFRNFFLKMHLIFAAAKRTI
jgi:hypothetical protein